MLGATLEELQRRAILKGATRTARARMGFRISRFPHSKGSAGAAPHNHQKPPTQSWPPLFYSRTAPHGPWHAWAAYPGLQRPLTDDYCEAASRVQYSRFLQRGSAPVGSRDIAYNLDDGSNLAHNASHAPACDNRDNVFLLRFCFAKLSSANNRIQRRVQGRSSRLSILTSFSTQH